MNVRGAGLLSDLEVVIHMPERMRFNWDGRRENRCDHGCVRKQLRSLAECVNLKTRGIQCGSSAAGTYVLRRDRPPKSVSRLLTNSTITGRTRFAAIFSTARAMPLSTSFFWDLRPLFAFT